MCFSQLLYDNSYTLRRLLGRLCRLGRGGGFGVQSPWAFGFVRSVLYGREGSLVGRLTAAGGEDGVFSLDFSETSDVRRAFSVVESLPRRMETVGNGAYTYVLVVKPYCTRASRDALREIFERYGPRFLLDGWDAAVLCFYSRPDASQWIRVARFG